VKWIYAGRPLAVGDEQAKYLISCGYRECTEQEMQEHAELITAQAKEQLETITEMLRKLGPLPKEQT
jgi:hypothetical protein